MAQQKGRPSRQADSILAKKNSRTIIQQKIDSRLLQAMNERNAKSKTTGVDPVNVNADMKGNLQVDIKSDVSVLLINKIKSLGGIIIFESKEYHSVRAEINLSMIEQIAALSQVRFIEPAVMAQLNRMQKPGGRQVPLRDTLQ